MSLTFTARQKHDALAREVKQREKVFGRMVAEGRMKPTQMDYHIKIMRAIAKDYEDLANAEDAKGRLL